MTEEIRKIKVRIAKLWASIQEVEINEGATAMVALRAAWFNLDSVVSIKRNGVVITLDTVMTNDDVALVSLDKIKGGADETETPVNLLKLSFKIVKENQADTDGQLAFTDDMSTFEIVKEFMHSKGVSLNSFKELKDAEGNEVTFGDKLVDGGSYKIVIADQPVPQSDDEDDED